MYAAGTAFPGLAFLPWTTIGIRASAVVMMVELRELVVLTAVAGHRLPHCWRDGCEQERGLHYLVLVGLGKRTAWVSRARR